MSEEDTISTLHQVHGLCMWLGIGLLVPIGIIAAKYKSLFGFKWYNIHTILQRLAIVLMLAGFAIAITFTQLDNPKNHFSQPHMIGGLVIFILILTQGIAGTFRPTASIGDGEKSKKRALWEKGHKYMGRIVWLVGQIVLFSGMRYIDETLSLVQIGWVLMVILVYVALRFKTYRDQKGKGYVELGNESMDKTAQLSEDKEHYP